MQQGYTFKDTFPEFHKSSLNKEIYFAFFTAKQIQDYKTLFEQVRVLDDENKALKAVSNSKDFKVTAWDSRNQTFSIYESEGVFTLFGKSDNDSLWLGDFIDLQDLIEVLCRVFTSVGRRGTKNEKETSQDN